MFIYSFILVQIFVIAINDVKHRKISNQWSIMNITLFIIMLFIAPESYSLSMNTFFYSLTFLAIGLVGFLLRIMGAGDSKVFSISCNSGDMA